MLRGKPAEPWVRYNGNLYNLNSFTSIQFVEDDLDENRAELMAYTSDTEFVVLCSGEHQVVKTEYDSLMKRLMPHKHMDCSACGTVFYTDDLRRRYCSDPCRVSASSKRAYEKLLNDPPRLKKVRAENRERMRGRTHRRNDWGDEDQHG